MDMTMHNDKLISMRYETLISEAKEKYADNPKKSKHITATLSTTRLMLSVLWAEFYDNIKYDTRWVMITLEKSTPFIKSFSQTRLKPTSLEDLPDDVITLFVIPETNRIEVIIGTTSVVCITIDEPIIKVHFEKENKFKLSEFVNTHVKAAIKKFGALTKLVDNVFDEITDDEDEDDEEYN